MKNKQFLEKNLNDRANIPQPKPFKKNLETFNTHSEYVQLVQTCSNLFKLAQTCSSLKMVHMALQASKPLTTL
jgi:hypothetical protein